MLAVLATTPTHGYEIARALSEAGIGEVKGGTLYPLLGRLETQGFVEADWGPSSSGPPRKCYAVTREGRSHLHSEGADWLAFTERASQLLRHANEYTEDGEIAR